MDFASSSSATASLEKETNCSDSPMDEFSFLLSPLSDILNELLTLNNIKYEELFSTTSERFSTECVDTHYKVSNYCDPSITQGKHTLDVGQPDIEYLNSEFKRVAGVCNWEKAKALLKDHPKQIRLSTVVGLSGETALHFAAWENQVEFVEELVNEMSEEDIAIETNSGETAFLYAVLSGHIEAARIILKKMPDLQIDALIDAIYCGSYDFAKEILSKNQRLAVGSDKKGVTALHAIAGRFSVSGGDEPSKSGVELMNSLLVKANGQADLVKVPLFEAAKQGNYEFLRIAQDLYPHLTTELRDKNRTILEVVHHHNPEILNKILLKPPLKKTEKKKRQREIKLCEEQGPIDRAVSTLEKHRTPSSEPKKREVLRKKTAKLPKSSIDADPELVLPSIPSELSHPARCEIPSTSSQHDEMMATNNEGLSNSPEKIKKKKNKKRATRLINPTSVRIAEPRKKPPSLKTLAIQSAGLYMRQLLEQLDIEAVSIFPLNVKLAFLAICRRKDLLDDDVINLFADEFIEILDVSDSYVTDFGLKTVALKCPNLLALDISGCSKITKSSVELLMKKCKKLKTLRWGGTSKCDRNAVGCLFLLERRLVSFGNDSWEDVELDEWEGCCLATVEWLIWPGIDDEMLRELADKYPYLVVNPPGSRSTPREALAVELDEIYVEGIDPIIWTHEPEPDSSSGGDT